MKKILALILALIMILPTAVFAADKEYKPNDVADKSEANVEVTGDAIKKWHFGGYIGFKDVDLTGVNSVILKGTYTDKTETTETPSPFVLILPRVRQSATSISIRAEPPNLREQSKKQKAYTMYIFFPTTLITIMLR